MSFNFSARVPVFDANIRVGDLRDEPSPCRNREELLAEMDRHDVERALVYHVQAETISPLDENLWLEDWLDESGRLAPQWVMLPTKESMAQVQALHDPGRVRSACLYSTRLSGLPFRPWAYGDLLSFLDDTRIPLWISLPDADADELVATLQTFPNLITVLVGAHYTHALWVLPIMQALPNAYLESSRYESIGEVESLWGQFGASRFVCGSWYWRFAMGPML